MSSRAAQVQMLLGQGIPYEEAVRLANGADARGASREAQIKAQARAEADRVAQTEEDKRRKAAAKDSAERSRVAVFEAARRQAEAAGIEPHQALIVATKAANDHAKALERSLSVPPSTGLTPSSGGGAPFSASAGAALGGSIGAPTTAPRAGVWGTAKGIINQSAGAAEATGYQPAPVRSPAVTASGLRAQAQVAARTGNVAAASHKLVQSFVNPNGVQLPDQAALSPGDRARAMADAGMYGQGPQVDIAPLPPEQAAASYVPATNPDFNYIDPRNFQGIIDQVTTPGFSPSGPAYGQYPGTTQSPQEAAARAAYNISSNPNNIGQNTESNLEFLRRLAQERVAPGAPYNGRAY